MIPAHVTMSPFVWVTAKLPDSHLYTSQWPGGVQNKLDYQLLPDGSSGADTKGGWLCVPLIFRHGSVPHGLMCSGTCFPSSLLSYHMPAPGTCHSVL